MPLQFWLGLAVGIVGGLSVTRILWLQMQELSKKIADMEAEDNVTRDSCHESQVACREEMAAHFTTIEEKVNSTDTILRGDGLKNLGLVADVRTIKQTVEDIRTHQKNGH